MQQSVARTNEVTSLTVSRSRTYPVEVEAAFDRFVPLPLPDLFSQRYGPMPPIKAVVDSPPTWGEVGQTRTILLQGGGSMRETLTDVDRPRSFRYRIDRITGPMKPLVDHVEGEWAFDPSGTGVRISWTWTFHPASRYSRPLVTVIGRFWQGYARQAFENAETLLVV